MRRLGPSKIVAVLLPQEQVAYLAQVARERGLTAISQAVRLVLAERMQRDRSAAKRRRAAPTAHGLPPDYVPQFPLEQLAAHGLNPHLELAAFRDHARATGRCAVDWDAAFRNWCRKSAKRRAVAS